MFKLLSRSVKLRLSPVRMLETPHVAVGAAIATKIPNPLISIPLAFCSHFILEMIPHWNPHLNTEIKKNGKLSNKTLKVISLDVFLSIFVGGFFAYRALPNTTHAITILLASFASVVPDLIEGPYFLLGIRSKITDNWLKIQKAIQNDTNIYYGLLTQGATVLAAFWWTLL